MEQSLNRHAQLTLSQEKFDYYSSVGNITDFKEELSESSGLDIEYINKHLLQWLTILTPKQLFVFKSYYIYRRSIIQIRYDLGANSNYDIDKCLKSAKNKIKKEISKIN